MTSYKKMTPSLFFGLLTGLLLAVLAFSQAAASIGLALDSFRPLGGSFFSWRAGQTRAAIALVNKGSHVNSAIAQRLGRAALTHAPLTPRSLWLVGKSMEIKGDKRRARVAMVQAERISRRDSAVQLWLGADRLANGAIAPGLRHYDLMIRSDQQAASAIIPRMAMIMLAPEGRRQLAPYIRDDNPWLLSLFQSAVTDLPRTAPVAQLLVDRRKTAPDSQGMRQVYDALMNRLVNERAYSLALRLYPLLPGAKSASLRNVSGSVDGQIDQGYPPFIWNFSDRNEQGAEFVSVEGGGTGLDIFGAPGTVGIAATKLVTPKPGDFLYWKVADRSSNMDGSASWAMTCVIGESKGKRAQSVNLLSSAVPQNRLQKMAIPDGCGLVLLEMHVAGGIGRDPIHLTVSALKLAPDSNAK